jgi:hypothetical protein
MKQDQIIQMLHKVVAENQNFTTWTVSTPHLVALVHHAIAEEREACAKVCEGRIGGAVLDDQWMLGFKAAMRQCATAIRARGQA